MTEILVQSLQHWITGKRLLGECMYTYLNVLHHLIWWYLSGRCTNGSMVYLHVIFKRQKTRWLILAIFGTVCSQRTGWNRNLQPIDQKTGSLTLIQHITPILASQQCNGLSSDAKLQIPVQIQFQLETLYGTELQVGENQMRTHDRWWSNQEWNSHEA